MCTVAITGVAGHVGTRLLRLLDADPTVDHVIGMDARDPGYNPGKLDFYRVDQASADLKPLLEGVDVLAHLAFMTGPAHETDLLHRVNIEGTRRLLEAAGVCGVRHVVYISSAMVYGAWPDNPIPLTEDAVIRPRPGFGYALQKAETERLLADWREDHSDRTITVLRPAAAPGVARDSWLARVWRLRSPLQIRGVTPPAQFVHEDDLAAAVDLAIRSRLDGVFNVAPDGWIPGDAARELADGIGPALPRWLVRNLLEVGWTTGLSGVPPSVLPYVEHPWVVANDRLRAAGWRPGHTNEEAYVAGSQRLAWQGFLTRHRQDLALAVPGAALAGMFAAGFALWRRRRRTRSGALR